MVSLWKSIFVTFNVLPYSLIKTDHFMSLDDRHGQSMIEYTLLLALLSLFTFAALSAMGVSVNDVFEIISDSTADVATSLQEAES